MLAGPRPPELAGSCQTLFNEQDVPLSTENSSYPQICLAELKVKHRKTVATLSPPAQHCCEVMSASSVPASHSTAPAITSHQPPPARGRRPAPALLLLTLVHPNSAVRGDTAPAHGLATALAVWTAVEPAASWWLPSVPSPCWVIAPLSSEQTIQN